MRQPPQPLTSDEARSLLAECGDGRPGARKRALGVVLWRVGLRAAWSCARPDAR